MSTYYGTKRLKKRKKNKKRNEKRNKKDDGDVKNKKETKYGNTNSEFARTEEYMAYLR